MLVDGGHNPAGLKTLARQVRRLIDDGRLVVVFGAMADKDLPAMLRQLRALAPDAVIFTAAPSAGPRAADPARLKALWGAGAETIPDSQAAVDRGRGRAGPEGTVLVCGSLYLVGDVRRELVPA